jgi:mannitol/fructose-specific phosphotransferase system IIA component
MRVKNLFSGEPIMVRESLTSATHGHAIAMPHWSDEETHNPVRAGDRDFYKLEK